MKTSIGLFTLLTATGILSAGSAVRSDDSAFLIRPHFYSYKGKPAIAWVPSGKSNKSESASHATNPQTTNVQTTAPQTGPQNKTLVTFYEHGQPIATTEATDIRVETNPLAAPFIPTTGNLQVAPLPAECGWDDDFAFSVPGMDKPSHLEKLPCAESGENFKIAFITDTQQDYSATEHVGALVNQFHPNVVVHGGDHVHISGSDREWIQYFNALSPLYSHSILLGAVGNHEYAADPHAAYFHKFFGYPASEGYFSQIIGDVQFISLNSNFRKEEGLQQRETDWLEKTLQTPARWKIVFFHHTPYSSGILNTKIAPDREWDTVRQYFVPLFEKYHVQLVLAGHVHLYERSKVWSSNIVYINGGPAGGRMDYPTKPWRINVYSRKLIPQTRTWSEINVSRDALAVRTHDFQNKVIDSVTIKP